MSIDDLYPKNADAKAAMFSAPPGAQTYVDGRYYKVADDRLWAWDGVEWCRSTRSIHSVAHPPRPHPMPPRHDDDNYDGCKPSTR